MQDINQFLQSNKQQALTELQTLLGFQSVSTDFKFKQSVTDCAVYLVDYLKSIYPNILFS